MNLASTTKFVLFLILCAGVTEAGKKITEACKKQEECPENSSCTPRDCDGNVCLCNSNYLPSKNKRTCLRLVELRRSCASNTTTCRLLHTECDEEKKVCQCTDRNMPARDLIRCKSAPVYGMTFALLGEPCDTAKNIVCQDRIQQHCHPVDKVCRCNSNLRPATQEELLATPESFFECRPINYTLSNFSGKCEKVVANGIAILGEKCFSDNNCVEGAQCIAQGCSESICSCPIGMAPTSDRRMCKTVARLHRKCDTNDTVCMGSNSLCLRGTCSCPGNWVEAKNEQCIPKIYGGMFRFAALGEPCQQAGPLICYGYICGASSICECAKGFRPMTMEERLAFPLTPVLCYPENVTSLNKFTKEEYEKYCVPPKPVTPATMSVTASSLIEVTNPQPSSDYINPQPSSDYINPQPSSDYIKPQSSSDYIKPQPSSDYIKPQPSSDHINPQPSSDYINHQPSSDYIKPQPSSDYINPQPSSDYIKPQPSSDYIKPQSSSDYIKPQPSSDHINPQPSSDHINPQPSSDYINPQPSSDHINPQPSSDYINPQPSSDYINHQPSSDYIKPQPSSDYINPQPSSDYIKPQPSSDYIKPQSSSDYIKPQPSSDHINPQPSSDHINPQPSSDYINPQPSSDHINPQPSSDYINPQPSSDHINPQPSSDYINPQPSSDYINPQPSSDYINPQPSSDYIKPQPSSDYINPQPSSDHINPQPSSDYIKPQPSSDYINPQPSSDYINPQSSVEVTSSSSEITITNVAGISMTLSQEVPSSSSSVASFSTFASAPGLFISHLQASSSPVLDLVSSLVSSFTFAVSGSTSADFSSVELQFSIIDSIGLSSASSIRTVYVDHVSSSDVDSLLTSDQFLDKSSTSDSVPSGSSYSSGEANYTEISWTDTVQESTVSSQHSRLSPDAASGSLSEMLPFVSASMSSATEMQTSSDVSTVDDSTAFPLFPAESRSLQTESTGDSASVPATGLSTGPGPSVPESLGNTPSYASPSSWATPVSVFPSGDLPSAFTAGNYSETTETADIVATTPAVIRASVTDASSALFSAGYTPEPAVQKVLLFDFCQKSSECPKNASCRVMGCKGHICMCEKSLVSSENRTECVGRASLGETCSDNIRCIGAHTKCGLHARCVCNWGYNRTDDGRCRENVIGLRLLGESCNRPGEFCNSSFEKDCIDGKCQCNKTAGFRKPTENEIIYQPFHMLECRHVNDTLDILRSDCPTIKTVKASQKCSKLFVCPEFASCDLADCGLNLCRCNHGYGHSPDYTECWKLVKLGEVCSGKKICRGAFTRCDASGRCTCKDSHKRSGDFCTTVDQSSVKFSLLGGNCDNRKALCLATSEQTCVGGLCVCNHGLRPASSYEFIDQYYSRNQCRPVAKPNDSRTVMKCNEVQRQMMGNYQVQISSAVPVVIGIVLAVIAVIIAAMTLVSYVLMKRRRARTTGGPKSSDVTASSEPGFAMFRDDKRWVSRSSTHANPTFHDI